MSADEEPRALQHCETLNRAVRELAVGTGTLYERIAIAGRVLLAGLSARELEDADERRTLARIEVGLMELAVGGTRHSLRVYTSAEEIEQAVANDLLDLHEMVEARAILEAAGD